LALYLLARQHQGSEGIKAASLVGRSFLNRQGLSKL